MIKYTRDGETMDLLRREAGDWPGAGDMAALAGKRMDLEREEATR